MAGLPRLRVWSLYPGTKVDTVCVMYVEHVFVVGVCQSPSNFDCSQLPGGGNKGACSLQRRYVGILSYLSSTLVVDYHR